MFEIKKSLLIYSKISELDQIHNFVKDLSKNIPLNDNHIYHLTLALEEACVNIMKHSYHNDPTKTISIEATFKENELTFKIEDNGPSFDPRSIYAVEEKKLQKNIKKGGWGILLISRIIDRIDYIPKNQSSPYNQLILTKILE
ncbi:MAG: ATP-binding protein [Candidatus Kapaibacteriota bacterium]